MSFYSWAFNDLDDPYWACVYNVDTHPLYHQCDKCPSYFKCSAPHKIILYPQFELPPKPPPKPPEKSEPLPHQDVTGDELFNMLLQRLKRFFGK